MTIPDLAGRRRIHIIGIGGAGMSAIATALIGMGHEVSGSDLKDGPELERLRGLGAEVHVGHDGANLAAAELVAASTAIGPANPERIAAGRLGLAVARRCDLLAAICKLRRTIAVSGTHGKTTTSSMLALMLIEAGMKPSFIVGGDINEIGANACWDEGDWLVVEADESDGTFLELDKEIAVVTSVEPDHLQHYGNFAALRQGFVRFAAGAKVAVVSADDEGARQIAPEGAVSFGFSERAALRIVDFAPQRTSSRFVLSGEGMAIDCSLPVPGRHNARNAAAAAAAARRVGATAESIAAALGRFGGVARRFEFRGEVSGAVVVDDYAHLPGEVEAALDAARSGGFDRIVCVFQPHRYSRVESLGAAFADSFAAADVLFVTDIYGAGEEPRPGVSAALLIEPLRRAHPRADVRYAPSRGELVAELSGLLQPGDCCLLLGAGDVTDVTAELLAQKAVL